MYQQRTGKSFTSLPCFAFLAFLVFVCNVHKICTYAADSDFEISSEGVLTKYYGTEKTVIVPEGVKKIGKNAFSGNGLIQKVVLPSTVTEICTYAFIMNENLREIVFSRGLKIIDDYGIFLCDLKKVYHFESQT